MKKLLAFALLGVMVLVLAACGSSETKTVTETVESKPPAQESSPENSSEEEDEEVTTDEPTATTIPDGTWAKGEYTPGQYRAPGGSLCSWEQDQKLGGEAAGEGFNENYGIGEKNILIEINAPYFKTEECGVWHKVG